MQRVGLLEAGTGDGHSVCSGTGRQRSAEDGLGLTRSLAVSECGWARARGMLLFVTIS